MALKDFLALADDKLHEVFHKKEPDHAKAREAMNKRLDTAHSQFSSATPVKGKKMFKISNGVVKLTLPFEVSGKTEFNFPSERFADAIAHLKDAVTKGEADKELTADQKSVVMAKKPRAPRDPNAPKVEKAGWTDERRERFAASIAARKAAKG